MTEKCGFKAAKKGVINCLTNKDIQHELRNNIDEKNLLANGEISADYLIEILKKSRGNEYENSPHHLDKNIEVHIIKTKFDGVDWYIKWYFSSPECVFISVH